MIQGRPPWGRLHIFLGGVGAFGAYILLVVVAVGGCRGWWGDNAPAALHKVGGEGNGACGAYMLFLFCHAGRVGAFGATYCLWLVVVGGCRGWWGDNAPLALHKVGGRQGRLRRLHVFLFFWAPSAGHIVGEHDSVVSDDCPTNRVPLLVGLTTMASSATTAAGAMPCQSRLRRLRLGAVLHQSCLR